MNMQINPYQRPLHSTAHTTYRVSDGPLSSSSSEVGNIAQGVGQVIQDYNNKIHDSLEDWNKLNEELSDLLKVAKIFKPIGELLITLKKISAGDKNVTISGKEAALFLELGKLLGPDYSSNIHIEGMSYSDNNNYTDNYVPAGNLEWALSTIYQSPSDITMLTITLSPSDAQGTEDGLNTDLSKDGYNFGSLSGISQTIASMSQTVASLKNEQTRDLFKIMSLSNAKKSNEKSLSSIFQILKSITSSALSNIQ